MHILVSGSTERASSLRLRLEGDGHQVTTVTDLDQLPSVVEGLAPGSIDAYVQLPTQVRPAGDTMVELVRDFLAQGIMSRFSSVSAVMPALATDGGILLVSGNHPDQAATPDDQAARTGLLNLLAHSARADAGDGDVWVRVIGRKGPRTDDELAAAVRSRGVEPRPRLTVEGEEEMDYTEWRMAVLSLEHGVA